MQALNVHHLIDKVLNAPKTHKVETSYEDGTITIHQTHSAASAETFAVGQRRKIGKVLISRKTGEEVKVVKVSVSLI